MKIALIVGSIILPLFMFYVQHRWKKLHRLFDLLMLISTLILGNIASLSIYQIIQDHTVFMTAIHAVFLNPFFLITGAYIGVYTLYRLMFLGKKEYHDTTPF